MSSSDNVSDQTPVTENPQVRLFLDRAAAVVRQCGGLDARCRVLLGLLAKELGLSREEVEPAIRTLIITTEDFSSKSGNGRSSDRLTPPAPPPLPQPHANGSCPNSAPAAPLAEPPIVVIDDNSVLQNFTDRAAYVLAQHGGWNPKTRAILSQLAREMGVTAREMESALATLQSAAKGVEFVANTSHASSTPPTPPPLPGDIAPTSVDADAPSSEPAEIVPPPLPPPKPRDVYCSYLNKAIDELVRPRINPRRERRLIEQAVDKLGLSPVFARQLLCNVAAQRGVTVESQKAKSADAPPMDDRQAELLRQARAIIAEQRGVTLAGQVKIAAVAQELGLSDEDRQQALALLQSGAEAPTNEEQQREERLAAFRTFVQPCIASMPRKIITPDVVAQFVQRGCDYFGVESDEAEKTVREAASAAGLRYVSQQRAVEHLSRLVAEKLGGLATLRESDRERIFAEGAHWGLNPLDIEAVVAEQVETNRALQAARRRRSQILLGVASIAAALFLTAAVGWRLVDERNDRRNASAEGSGAFASSDHSQSTGEAAAGDHWWDANLALAMNRAEVELHFVSPSLKEIRSSSPAIRGNAYGGLVAGLSRAVESSTASSVMQQVVAGCYALDPSDAAAARLRERLIDVFPEPGAPLPSDSRSFRKAYCAADMLVAAATRPDAPSGRTAEMRQSLGKALGISIDPAWDKSELRQQTFAALTRLLYRVVTEGATKGGATLQPLYAYVAAESTRYLDQETADRLDARFLDALFAHDESTWRQYQEPILRVVNSNDPTTVLQAVELLERASDIGLRGYLAAGLARRLGKTSTTESVEDIIALVRKEFGVAATPSAQQDDGWQRLRREADEVLNSLAGASAESRELFEETVKLTKLAAMGALLAQGEFGSAAWQQLVSIEPVALEPRPAETDELERSGDALTMARSRLVRRYIEGLARATHPVQRVGYLRGVAENAAHVRELEPQDAQVLARYLLSPKTEEEREAISEYIPQVGRWKTVRLALADTLSDAQVRQELVEEVVSQVLESASKLGGGENWKQQLRLALMRSVLDGAVSAPDVHPYDVAQSTILAVYQTQAKAMGVRLATDVETVSVPAVLRALIEARAARLLSKASNEEDRQFLARLPHELIVAEYLGDNDLRRQALLERVWLRILAMDVSLTRSERADTAKEIVEQLKRQDRAADDVLTQLRNGQAALVRLWQLHEP